MYAIELQLLNYYRKKQQRAMTKPTPSGGPLEICKDVYRILLLGIIRYYYYANQV